MAEGIILLGQAKEAKEVKERKEAREEKKVKKAEEEICTLLRLTKGMPEEESNWSWSPCTNMS